MVRVSTQRWESLAKWSATAFIVAGISQLLRVGLQNMGAFMEMTSSEWSRDLTLLIAFVAAYIGLFGLYPRIADRAPRISKTGAVLAGLAGVAIVASLSLKYLHGAAEPPGPLKILPLLYLVGSPLSFLLFGVASWRTRTPSRIVGLLLFGAFTAFLFLIVGIFTQSSLLFSLFPVIFAVAMLGIGYALHTEGTLLDTTDSGREPAG